MTIGVFLDGVFVFVAVVVDVGTVVEGLGLLVGAAG